MSILEEVKKPLKVMGMIEEVSKVFPLWSIFEYGTHRKML
jgi:hypothetical protein